MLSVFMVHLGDDVRTKPPAAGSPEMKGFRPLFPGAAVSARLPRRPGAPRPALPATLGPQTQKPAPKGAGFAERRGIAISVAAGSAVTAGLDRRAAGLRRGCGRRCGSGR